MFRDAILKPLELGIKDKLLFIHVLLMSKSEETDSISLSIQLGFEIKCLIKFDAKREFPSCERCKPLRLK